MRNIKPGMEISEELAELQFRYDMLYLVNPGLIEVKKELGWDYPSNVYDVMAVSFTTLVKRFAKK